MNKVCKFLYRGINFSFLMGLSAPDGLFGSDAKSVPFCIGRMAGSLIERLYDAFESGCAAASLHVPVYAKGRWEFAHIDLEFDITPRPADHYDDVERTGEWAALPADGDVTIAKYEGPASWRQENWARATVAASFGKD